ncbi:MAG: hypothetical protein GY895_14555 [Phycisphaera sp.]|nr:hypothetical protein [Phycisphaera sp.]
MPLRLQKGPLASFLLLLGGLTACAPPIPSGGFDAPDPASRIYAAVRVAAAFGETGARPDEATLRDLVEMLLSTDPAERLVAGDTLELVTGEDFGFDAADPFVQRVAAADRWAAWVGRSTPEESRGGSS